ncbi:MAG TPA: hypothetical protein VMR98_04110, partial [Candidatus Polarisedimenticolaceae bacterium]|nr:hypothetical protein [Candidatus Polarisedimenticolaceae bacterium]
TNVGIEDTATPYSVSWNTVTATNGSHQLTAVARDAAGNVTTSVAVTVIVSNAGGGGTPLAINGAQRFQTIDGWGVSANSASWDNGELIPALDTLLNNGSTIWRVVVEKADWEAINDNSDPNTFNWTYYNTIYSSPKFQEFWSTVSYLNSKGITNNLYLATMGRGPDFIDHASGGVSSATDEDEWVEMLASMIYYARNTQHVQFGSVSPGNESDLGGVEGIRLSEGQLARMYNKLALKLDAIGLGDVRIIAPEAAFVDGCQPNYITALFAYPVLMSKIDHISVHNYNGTTGCTDSTIKNSAYSSKNFWISEFGQFTDAMSMLDEGPSALLMWDGYDSVYNHAIDAGRGTVAPNDSGDELPLLAYNATSHTYTPRKALYEEAQLFKYVPKGSARIGAIETNANTTVYAFHDPVSNRVTIVGQNLGPSDVTFSGTLSNLPSISMLEYYTTDNFVNLQRGSDVPVTGNAFSVIAPGNGIFTLTYSPPADQVVPSAPSDLQASGSIGAANLSWAAATDNVGVTAYNIHRSTTPGFTASAANKIGQTGAIAYTDLSAPAGTYYYQVTAQDGAGNIGLGSNETQATVLADTQAPTAPTTLQTTSVGGQSIGLSWSASTDNVGVAG